MMAALSRTHTRTPAPNQDNMPNAGNPINTNAMAAVKINKNCPMLDLDDPKYKDIDTWAFTVLYTCDQANKWNVKASLGNMVNFAQGRTRKRLMGISITGITTIEQLVQAVKQKLVGVSGLTAWSKIIQLKLRRSETLQDYFNRAKKLHRKCGEINFECYCEAIIKGLMDKVDKNDLAKETFTNTDELEAAMNRKIKIEKKLTIQQADNTEVTLYLQRDASTPYDMDVDKINEEKFDKITVERIEWKIQGWVCNNPNHRKKDCPKMKQRSSRTRGISAAQKSSSRPTQGTKRPPRGDQGRQLARLARKLVRRGRPPEMRIKM